MEHQILPIVLFVAFFLSFITLLQNLTDKISFPYTVALLMSGFATQYLTYLLDFHLDLELTPETIFYLLLPILLFEATLHINVHQFRLQFKTISFLATFGLLVSVLLTGLGVSLLIGMPLGVALLFGAIISSTDPIAVLALFKTLGAPKRLALLADGESMFNDATGVIVFRLVSAFVLSETTFSTFQALSGIGDFLYVFLGSLLFGTFLGYLTSRILPLLKNDRILINTVTAALAIGSFVTAEHYFHLSGVISTVMAGITLGNIGRHKIPVTVIHFIEEFWAFMGFIAVSLVFFFASFNLDTSIFFANVKNISLGVGVMLLARAISIYLSVFLTNHSRLFKDEPNIPLSWQHILNWGGLRGVIPLVLAYSLPKDFQYREEILGMTLAALVFTLIINGLTIKWLLKYLRLHLPKEEEIIIRDEKAIFNLEKQKENLANLPKREFDQNLIKNLSAEIQQQEIKLKTQLFQFAQPEILLRSLKMQALEIERAELENLYHQGRFSENVYYIFSSELDLQYDALEHPEMTKARATTKEGYIDTRNSYRKRLIRLRKSIAQFPILKKVFNITEEDMIEERYQLLSVRVFTSFAVLDYLKAVENIFTDKLSRKAINEVRSLQQHYIRKNQKEIQKIEHQSSSIVNNYQKQIIGNLLYQEIKLH